MGSTRTVNRIAQPDQRAETVSVLYIVVYLGVTSILLVGIMASWIGLQQAVVAYLMVLALFCTLLLVKARAIPWSNR